MRDCKLLVESFYNGIWNRRDYTIANELLTPDFRFRGSLGDQTVGIPAFLAYVDSVHTALAEYRCTIEELIADQRRASARMQFCGRHQAVLLGVAATGRVVSWAGAAFFTTRSERIATLWVLGDMEGLKRQLTAPGAPPS